MYLHVLYFVLCIFIYYFDPLLLAYSVCFISVLHVRLIMSVVTGWTVMDMSNPLLLKRVPEIDADPRSSRAKEVAVHA